MKNRAAPLVLTGQRRRRSYGIMSGGRLAWLPGAPLGAFLKLVEGKLSPGGDFVTVSPTHVCRIRRALGKVLGVEEAYRLIAEGGEGTYALAWPAERFAADPSFRTYPLPEPLHALRRGILRAIDEGPLPEGIKPSRAKRRPSKAAKPRRKRINERAF